MLCIIHTITCMTFECSNFSAQRVIEELQKDNIDIWHISSSMVELCTAMSDHELTRRYKLHCHTSQKLKDLLKLENMKEDSSLRFVSMYVCIYMCMYNCFKNQQMRNFARNLRITCYMVLYVLEYFL